VVAPAALGIGLDPGGRTLVDGRPAFVRRGEARALRGLLWRGRLRALARWSREPWLYRGWLRYLFGKLARARG
jgi:hypothetical protein